MRIICQISSANDSNCDTGLRPVLATFMVRELSLPGLHTRYARAGGPCHDSAANPPTARFVISIVSHMLQSDNKTPGSDH